MGTPQAATEGRRSSIRIMEIIFIAITLIATLGATFLRNMRRAILSLWIVGLGIGALYLTLGAEFLAIIQWIVSTLITISFIFFSVMFGEYNFVVIEKPYRSIWMVGLFTLLIGGGFTFMIYLGSGPASIHFHSIVAQVSLEKLDLQSIGRALTQKNFLALEVLALILFLVLVGGGVVARIEREGS